MSVITDIIAPQSFEVVRDRIGRILADELLNQFTLSSNPVLKVSNWVERFLPFDSKEIPAVNICMAEGSYGGQTVIQTDGTYRYYIDCYTQAASHDNDPADSKAMYNLQRLMGVCRSILEDPRYKTLGFATPSGFIMSRHIESIHIREPRQKEHDQKSTAEGRLVFTVKIPEYPGGFVVPVNGKFFVTTVKLDSTEKGYRWVTDNSYDDYDFATDL